MHNFRADIVDVLIGTICSYGMVRQHFHQNYVHSRYSSVIKYFQVKQATVLSGWPASTSIASDSLSDQLRERAALFCRQIANRPTLVWY